MQKDKKKSDLDIDLLFKSYNNSIAPPNAKEINDTGMINMILAKAKPKKKSSFFLNLIFNVNLKIKNILASSADTKNYILYPAAASAIVIIFALSIFFYQQKETEYFAKKEQTKQIIKKNESILPVDTTSISKKPEEIENPVVEEKVNNELLEVFRVNKFGFAADEIYNKSIDASKSIFKNNSINYEVLAKHYIITKGEKDTITIIKEGNSIKVKLSNKNNKKLNKITKEIIESLNTIFNQ